jgi:hypothetical protein
VSYYDGDPWSNHVLNEIKCGECEQEYDEQEGEGNVCPACKEKEGEGEEMKAESYQIVLEVTTESDPNEWDWGALLGLNPVNESYRIYQIGQITRNNQEPLCGDHIEPIRKCGCLL